MQQILVNFLHDAADPHVKGQWLRRAMELPETCDDSVVEERLQATVAHLQG